MDRAARTLYPHMLRLPVPAEPSDPAARSSASSWLDAERDNLVAIIQYAADNGPAPLAWLLADSLRGYFWLSMRTVDWATVATAALGAASARDAVRAQAAARLSLADLSFRMSDYRPAVAHYTRALMLARRSDWAECQAAVLGNLGLVYWQSGRLTRAVTHFSRALDLSRHIGQLAGQAAALGNLGLVHWQLGRLMRAAEHYLAALELYRRIESRYGEAINLANLGQVRHAQGHFQDAADLLASALTLHLEAGDRYGETDTRRILAGVLADTRRPDEALEQGQLALESARAIEDPRAEAEALILLAGLRQRRGDRRQAVREFQQALELVRTTGDRYPEVEALIGLATAESDLDLARRVADLSRQAGYRVLEGQAMTAAAGILLTQGNPAEAVRQASNALAAHRETGHRLGEVNARLLLDGALRHTASDLALHATAPHRRVTQANHGDTRTQRCP